MIIIAMINDGNYDTNVDHGSSPKPCFINMMIIIIFDDDDDGDDDDGMMAKAVYKFRMTDFEGVSLKPLLAAVNCPTR